MRARNTPKSRSGNSTPPPRDVDLLESDQFLPAGELDELWEWFYNAFNDNIDPELIFVKIINSARNPYRHHIPVGYSTSGPQDLISLEHVDEVEQLKTVVNTLRSEISGKDQVISSLEASNRESERQWARELADKEKELEKREEELGVLRLKEKEFEAELTSRDERPAQEKEDLVETTNRQKAEIVALSEKREELVALLQSLTKDQLHTTQLYREALERQQQITTVQDEKMKLIEEKLAATQTKLADKEKDLESKQTSLLELHLLIESHDETLAQRLSEAEEKNLESRRELVSAVCIGLTKKSLTPSSIGLTDEEWLTNKDSPAPAPPQRGWTWRLA